MDQDKEKGRALASLGPEPGPKPHRVRHDGFTPARKRKFFKTLRKTGCLSDSARVAGVSRETVRRHRNKWPDFATRMKSELAFASGVLEAIAWQRATVGAEERIYRDGKLAFVRVKPSDALLRLLLQGADPKRYGRAGRTLQKAAAKKLREELRLEIEEEANAASEESRRSILDKLERMHERERRRKLAEGYSEGPEETADSPGLDLRAERTAREGRAMSGGGHRRATVAALLAGTAAPADEGAEERAAERRVAARLVWTRRTLDALWDAQEALDLAWSRQLEPYHDWDEGEIPELPDPPEQELVDRLWKEIDDVCKRDRWPRRLYWSL